MKFHLSEPTLILIRLLLALALAAIVLMQTGNIGTRRVQASPSDTIVVTSPNNTAMAESDDYATQVLGDPWDMNNAEDTDYLDHITPPAISNGIWSANTTSQYASIFLQYQGWDNSMTYTGERSGINYPIDSHRFTHMRFRMYSSVADRFVVFWFRPRTWSASAGNSNIITTQAGWHVYDVDLTAGGGGGTGNWTAENWAGLRLDPIFGLGHSNANIQLDWVRLTPATGSNLNITWTASGTSSVSLYLDTDTNAGNGTETQIASNLPAASGSYNWNTANIAPGTYYIRAVMGSASAYSGALNVNAAPVLNITAPSTSSGEDYASVVLGKPWTMSTPTDLQRYFNLSNISYIPHYMQASSTDDPQLWYLNLDTAHAIDTTKYHYFNYNMWLQGPPDAISGQYDQWNGGPRVIWSPGAPLNWQVTSVVIQWYNRWMHVGMDLRTVPLEPGSNVGWNGSVSIFRFDPHEQASGTNRYPPLFRLGQVRLTADPTVADGAATTISWVPSKNSGTVTLYYSSSPGGSRTQIGTATLGSGAYVWPVNGLANGNYWITAVANDGLNTYSQTSLVPLKVTGSRACPPSFSDVDAPSPFYQYISNLVCRNVAEGYINNTFQPNAYAWRGTLAKWIVLARGWTVDTMASQHFNDVPNTDPLFPYIETAYNHGVISGYSDGSFRPYTSVTRGQMSKMVVNAMGWAIDTSGGPHFSDVDAQNPFYGQIETIYHHGVISGYSNGTFLWGNSLTARPAIESGFQLKLAIVSYPLNKTIDLAP